ncbi:MAG: hypothetical protein V3T77_05220 [Planctomycetota bacterium]
MLPKNPRLRRALAVTVAIAVLLAAGRFAACWLLADRPLPLLSQLLPEGGVRLELEVPRGFLDKELQELLEAMLRHLDRDGETLVQVSEIHARAPALPWLLRTRPWRLAWWSGEERASLMVGCFGGLGRLGSLFPETDKPHRLSIGNDSWWLSYSSGVVLLSRSPGQLREILSRLATAQREPVATAEGVVIRSECIGNPAWLASLPWRPLLGVPCHSLTAQLLPEGEDRWTLKYQLESPEEAPIAVGVSSWHKFLVGEGIRVELRIPCQRTAATIWQGEWALEGVRRAVQQLCQDLDSWSFRK